MGAKPHAERKPNTHCNNKYDSFISSKKGINVPKTSMQQSETVKVFKTPNFLYTGIVSNKPNNCAIRQIDVPAIV